MNEAYYKKYLKYKSLYLNLKSTGGAQPIKSLKSFQDLVSLLMDIKTNSNVVPKESIKGTIYEIYNISPIIEITKFNKLYERISTNYNQYNNLIALNKTSFSLPQGSTDSHLYIVEIRNNDSSFYINRTNLMYMLRNEQGARYSSKH
jgi:hypothetical protein